MNSELKQNSIFPLTESQKGVFFECMENPASTTYNIPLAVYLPETVDIDRFEKAIIETARLHPALFVNIRMENGEPVMVCSEKEIKVLRTKGNTGEAKAGFVRPFDLKNDSLFRFEICTDENGSVFLLDVHHLIFDGTSFKLFLSQIIDCYSGKEIKGESRSIFDISGLGDAFKETDDYRKAQRFFRDMLEGREFNCDLISDRREKGSGFGSLTLSAPGELSRETIEKFTESSGITAATLFTAAFAYTLSVFTGSDEACFTTVSSGRHCTELPDAVGMFVKTLPVCIDIPGEEKTIDFLSNFKKVFHGAVRNECISFGELASAYGANSKIFFVYQAGLLTGFEIDGARIVTEDISQSSPSDILFMMLRDGDGFRALLQFNNEIYTEGYVRSLCETVFETVKGMISKEKLCDIQLVSNRQKEFIDAFNNTESDYDRSETVNSAFDKIIEKYPRKTALVYKDNRYTYEESDCITKKIAGFVSSLGISAEEFVAVLAPRDDFAVLSAWGVIRSGAAFQMLDSTYPPERINYMLADSKARLLIADRRLIHLIENYEGTVLYTDEIASLPQCDGLNVNIRPENAITMIYTSGTTGKPKGSVLENRNLAAFFRNHSKVMEIDENSHIATYASFGFDAGIMDIITTMMSGAALYIVPDEIRLDMIDVEKFYISNEITHGFMTTQVGRMFAEITKCKTLKAFMVGGEKLVPFKVQDSFRFINGYGPCETMAYVCHNVVRDNSLLQPIGIPSGNTKLFVADKYGRLLPLGAAGELCISGAQVGRGYLGLPEKTSQVFVSNTFTSAPGYERMYKSGDIVRLLPEGNIDYVGRRDGQVKIRGFRVELTEIEEVIRRFDGVKDATVTAFDEAAGGKYIAAYVTGDSEINIDALHKFIGSEKPAYMIPKVTMQIEAIPYNQNQKVNRRALPVPEVRHSGTELSKPETELQKMIFALAAQILGHNNFGIDSDLFESGLTSIGLLRFNSLLSDEMNIDIGISAIRKNSTVRALADLARESRAEDEFSVLGDYPLMKNQLGVFLDCLRNDGSLIYNIPVLMKLSPEIDAERLKMSTAAAIDAHPYIKSTLKTDDEGNVRLVRNDETETEVSVIEADALPPEDKLIRPFDIMGGGLYRAEIYVTPEAKYLFIDVHHILSDGTSLAVLFDDINLAYEGKDIENEQFSGFDKALDEENLSEEKVSACNEYFGNLLEGCSGDCLPEFCPESDEAQCGEYLLKIENCSSDITAFCNKNNFSPNAFFNGVFGYTLSEILHSDDVTYCTIYNGRSSARLGRSFAMLVRTLPVRFISGNGSSSDSLVSDMQSQLLDTMANDAVTYMELSDKYRLKPDIFFNYQGDNFIFDNIGGKKAELQPVTILPAKAPLTIEIFLENGTYSIKISYRKNCYNKDFVSSLSDRISGNAKKFANEEKLDAIQVSSVRKPGNASAFDSKKSRSAVRGEVDKATEKKISGIFASVLGLEEVLSDESFFEIGGTSLSASKVTMMLMSEGIEVKYGDIFDNPSPSELAAFIRARDNQDSDSPDSVNISESTTREALKWNLPKYAKEVKREPLGNVLLTGAVGFLGVHILKELLEIEKGHIYCLVRKGSYESAEVRLRTMLFYYFSNGFEEEMRERITLIDADITDTGLGDVLKDIPFDTVINCAACVKHFADGDIIERINVRGVENLIDICRKRDKKLVQISTVSVPGIHTKESYEKQIKMHENELFVIDDMDNKYGISKYHAELKMFDAIESGMRGKVIRAGNLMGRHSDGEFQANMESNMFLSGIRGFATMGKYPISHMTDPMRFSPVDCTARAMVLLSGTNDKFTAFNCDNRYGFDEMKVIDACNRNGITILPADDDEYYAEFREMLGNEKMNAKLNGLAAYDIPDAHSVETDNLFTTNILYRIGFSWPLVDDSYLDRAINSIMTLDYFDLDSVQDE